MVTVKKEVPVESGVLEHVPQREFDNLDRPSASPKSLIVSREQGFWSHPGPVGPQEK